MNCTKTPDLFCQLHQNNMFFSDIKGDSEISLHRPIIDDGFENRLAASRPRLGGAACFRLTPGLLKAQSHHGEIKLRAYCVSRTQSVSTSS